jgi:hypothetical protein
MLRRFPPLPWWHILLYDFLRTFTSCLELFLIAARFRRPHHLLLRAHLSPPRPDHGILKAILDWPETCCDPLETLRSTFGFARPRGLGLSWTYNLSTFETADIEDPLLFATLSEYTFAQCISIRRGLLETTLLADARRLNATPTTPTLLRVRFSEGPHEIHIPTTSQTRRHVTYTSHNHFSYQFIFPGDRVLHRALL